LEVAEMMLSSAQVNRIVMKESAAMPRGLLRETSTMNTGKVECNSKDAMANAARTRAMHKRDADNIETRRLGITTRISVCRLEAPREEDAEKSVRRSRALTPASIAR